VLPDEVPEVLNALQYRTQDVRVIKSIDGVMQDRADSIGKSAVRLYATQQFSQSATGDAQLALAMYS